MNDILTANSFTEQQIVSDQDIYANLILSNLLDNNEFIKEHKDQETPIELTEDLIWVPAEKHPKIAPIEFAKFIKVQGTNIPVKRAASLQRKKSALSETYTAEDLADEEARTPSQKRKTDVGPVEEGWKADLNTALDEARPTVAKEDKALLRRSAFSARGRSRRPQPTARRSTSERKPATTTSSETWDRSEGISLYDQPVNVCEWIDLGSVSLESESSQRGILSRVHDAESQLKSHISNEPDEPKIQRPSMKRPPAVISARETVLTRKPSWFMGIFGAKQGGLAGPLHGNNPLSSLALLFNRTLKSTDTGKKQANKKMKPSRLASSSPPSAHTDTPFYHSHRLPLQVERAIYRLSHMKLADPKRQLRQQVMISNLMFWYLSIQPTVFTPNNSDNEQPHYAPMQQPRLPKKPSKMSRFIHAATRRTQEKQSQFDEDDDLPLSHYKRS